MVMVMVLYMLVIYSYVNGYFTLIVDYIVMRLPKQVLCIHFCFLTFLPPTLTFLDTISDRCSFNLLL